MFKRIGAWWAGDISPILWKVFLIRKPQMVISTGPGWLKLVRLFILSVQENGSGYLASRLPRLVHSAFFAKPIKTMNSANANITQSAGSSFDPFLFHFERPGH